MVGQPGDRDHPYDLATGDLVSEIVTTHDICLAMEVGFGSLWAGDCDDDTLLRVDLATGKLTVQE